MKKTQQRPSKAQHAEVIFSDALYTLPSFRDVTRVGRNTERAAAEQGLPLPTIRVGRTKFVQGADGIEWLKKISVAQIRTT